jgi:phage-related minor tail protein
MFQSIADSFADMVAKMIAEWLKAQLIQGFANIFSAIVPGIAGIGGGGLSSGFSAGASSAIDTSAAGWGAAFNTPLKFANGGIASGGFRAFANGGVVTGPTLGLVGEGRYNEAVIPLPDGKSVPVDLGGAMGNQITSNIVVNVSSDGKTSSSGAGSDSAGLGRKLEGAVKQVIVDELRPGGLLSGRR